MLPSNVTGDGGDDDDDDDANHSVIRHAISCQSDVEVHRDRKSRRSSLLDSTMSHPAATTLNINLHLL